MLSSNSSLELCTLSSLHNLPMQFRPVVQVNQHGYQGLKQLWWKGGSRRRNGNETEKRLRRWHLMCTPTLLTPCEIPITLLFFTSCTHARVLIMMAPNSNCWISTAENELIRNIYCKWRKTSVYALRKDKDKPKWVYTCMGFMPSGALGDHCHCFTMLLSVTPCVPVSCSRALK